MPGYVIAEIQIDDPVKYEEYKKLVPASIAAYGGKFIVRGGEATLMEGEPAPARIVILEFPSADAAKTWWASAEYEEAKALRQSASTGRLVVVEGFDG